MLVGATMISGVNVKTAAVGEEENDVDRSCEMVVERNVVDDDIVALAEA